MERFFIRVFPEETGFLWWCADLQSGHVVSPYDAIRTIIREKQNKAAAYQWPEGSEKWLLIYAAGNGLADMATNIKDPAIESIQPFDHVFLWDKFSETITALAPSFNVIMENAKVLYLRHMPASVHPFLDGPSKR